MDAFLTIYDRFVIPILFTLALLCAFWGVVDFYFLLRHQGKMKRGIRLFQKSLPQETEQFLRSLSTDVIVKRKGFIKETITGFIRVDKDERLIRADKRWRSTWPYVGYVDLSQPTPMLEYRSSLPATLLIAFWFLLTMTMPLVWLFLGALFFLIYYMELKAVEKFLQQQQKKRTKGSTF